MKQYLDIVKNVLEKGKMKGNRTGTRALTTFCEIFRHNMSEGFPLLTTKKVAFKTMTVELEGFIKGITDKRWYQERVCKIWNEWANPTAINERINEIKKLKTTKEDLEYIVTDRFRKQLQEEENDLGPIYGYQWRSFGQEYPTKNEFSYGTALDSFPKGIFKGIDQLKVVIDTLKNNPDDRRMVVSAWNPNQIHLMALPPCHYAFTLVHIDGVLNLSWKQRSCDLMLGVPFNIASYALLLLLICKETNLIPGELVGILEDCHIYENQIEQARKQVVREPRELPTLEVLDTEATSYSSQIKDGFDIFNWTYKDVRLNNYNPDSKIDFGPVAV